MIRQMQETISDKISYSEAAFIVFFAAMSFAKGMGLYEGQWPFELLLIIGCSAFTVNFLIREHTITELVISLVLIMIGIATYRASGEMGALLNIMIIVEMNGISVRKVGKLALFIWASTFVFQMLFSLSGLNKWQIFRIHHKLGHYIVRWSLGYTHPNVLHITYFILIALIMYMVRPKGKKLVWMTVLFMLGSIFVFLYSVSYTGMILVVIYLFLNIYYTCGRKLGIGEKILTCLIAPMAVLFSVGGPVILQGRLFDLFDHAMSTRFTLSRFFLTTQAINWFGTKSFDLPDTSYNIDCSYVYALMHYGIIYFILFTVLGVALIPYLMKRERYFELALSLGCLIAGITEPFLANTSFKNLTMIFIGEMLYGAINYIDAKETFLVKNKFVVIPSIGRKKIFNIFCVIDYIIDLLRHLWNTRRKYILIFFVCGALAGGIGYATVVREPATIYALLWHCDRKPGSIADTYVYLDKSNLPKDFDGWILSYENPQSPLYSFDGFTVDYEYFRRILGHAAAAGMMTDFIWLIIIQIPKKGISKKRKKTGQL